MQKYQRDHVFSRLNELVSKKRESVISANTTPEEWATVKDIVSGIKKGTIKPFQSVSLDMKVTGYTDIDDVFDIRHLRKAPRTDQKAVAREMAPIEAEAQRIKDELMLGSESDALEALRTFEKSITN